MSKIEALKYICSNYSGYQGGYQMSCLVEWDKIKDNIIPLFNLLNSQYILQETTSFFDEDGDHGGFTTDEIINDKVTIKGIEGILIFIRGKRCRDGNSGKKINLLELRD